MSEDSDYEIPETGAVFTFGRSRFAENLPSHFFIRNDPVLEISCGDDHTALVCKSGRAFLFGRNDYGQLGFGHKKDIHKPSCLKYLKPFHLTHVACGKSHTVIATSCTKIFAFGSNSDGQLGVGDLIDRTVPQMVQTDFLEGDSISAVAAGCHHSGFLTERGEIYMWGSNSDGQCGVEGDPYFVTPRKLSFDQPINSLSCGYYHTAFTSLGCVYTFGEEDNGKLGRLRTSISVGPNKVETEENCILVKCGGSHTLILTEDGAVYGFGSNFSGQLGIQIPKAESSTPIRIVFPNHNEKIVYLSCGESHSAFLSEEGYLYTCGDFRYGKLGNQDDSTNHMLPTMILTLENYFSSLVSCGGCHTMVLAKVRAPSNKTDFLFSQSNEKSLPPLKTKKDLAENLYLTNNSNIATHLKAAIEKEENLLKKYEDDGCETNFMHEVLPSQLDDIYTEIEEVITEKLEDQAKVPEFNANASNNSTESNESEQVVIQKESTIKKLLKVFTRKRSATAIVLKDQSENRGNEETEVKDSVLTGNQNNSKTCTIV